MWSRFGIMSKVMKPDFSLFSEESQEIAQQSYALALRCHHNHISREHVLLAFFETTNKNVVNLLLQMKVDISSARKRLEFLVNNRVPMVSTKESDRWTTSAEVKNFIRNSQLEMNRLGEKEISSQIFFLSLVQSYFSGPDADKTLQEILIGVGLKPDDIRRALLTKSLWEKSSD